MAEFQLPAVFKTGGPVSAAVKALQMEGLGDGIEASFGVIKILGKVWSLQYRGQNYPFMRADDGSARGFLDVVFVRVAQTKSKTFYKDGFKPGSKERPTCWSNNAVTPDATVPPAARQCDNCAMCPKNKVGSAVTKEGKPAKACSDHKKAAVFIDPEIVKTVMQEPLDEPVMLRIPASSLNDFSTFGANMEAQGFPAISYVTRLGFDPKVAHQKFTFQALRRLNDEECNYAIGLRNDVAAGKIISAGEILSVEDAAETFQQQAPAPNAGSFAPISTAPAAAEVAGVYDKLRAAEEAFAPKPPTAPVIESPAVHQDTAMVEEAPETSPDIDAKLARLLAD